MALRFALALGLVLAPAPAVASSILVDTGAPAAFDTGQSLFQRAPGTSWQTLAQEFTLTGAARVTEVQFYPGARWSEGDVRVWITDAIGTSATAGTNLLETLLVPVAQSTNATLVTGSGDALLSAGNYFLVFSAEAGFDGLVAEADTFPSRVGSSFFAADPGTPNLAFPPANDFNEVTFVPGFGRDIAFRLIGTPVPEAGLGWPVVFAAIAGGIKRSS